MSTENIGANEALPPRPSNGNGDGGEVRPGYPPAGQAERLAALARREAAADRFDPAQMDAELAALESGKETPEQRQQRLEKFLEVYFSDDIDPSIKELAVHECQGFEDDCRALFEEPNLQLGEEDATDPELKAKLVGLSENVTDVVSNEAAIVAATTERDELRTTEATNGATIETNADNIGAARAETAALQDHEVTTGGTRRQEEKRNTELREDTKTAEALQTDFEKLKAEHGTIAALKLLLDPETGVKSPEMKALVQNAVATAEALVGAIPGKEAATEKLLNQVGLNLGGGSQANVFANLFTAAEASDEFTPEEVEKLRAVVTGSDEAIRTGTDVLNTATATIIDPETGEEVPLHTAENKAEIYPGVYTYTENGENAVLELNIDGHYNKMDVTGMDGMTVGLVAEMMSWQAATEAMGATSFVESVYKLDFDFTGGGAYDVFSLIKMRNRLTTLVGNFEGHDGDIFDPRTREGLIKDQMRAASPTGTALGWENDHHGSLAYSRKLGLHNEVVLEEFSRYIQNARALGGAIDPADIHANLYRKFPDLVEAPQASDGQVTEAA